MIDDMTTTKLPPYGYGIPYFLTEPVEPTKPITECATCNNGCDCQRGIEGSGCAHHGCWGRAATNACPSATAMREYALALHQYVNDLHEYDRQSHRHFR